jgi:hypothetical protein
LSDDLFEWAQRLQIYLLREIDMMIAGQKSVTEESGGAQSDTTAQTLSEMVKLANELEVILARMRH